MLIAAPMHSERLSRGRIVQLQLFKVSKSSKRLQKIKKSGAHKIVSMQNMEDIECYIFHVYFDWHSDWSRFFTFKSTFMCITDV